LLLYHVPPIANAESILSDGWRDGDCPYVAVDDKLELLVLPCRGVWFSAEPMTDRLEELGMRMFRRKWLGALALFVVRAPADKLAEFELPDCGFGREWNIPASLVNDWPIVEVQKIDAANAPMNPLESVLTPRSLSPGLFPSKALRGSNAYRCRRYRPLRRLGSYGLGLSATPRNLSAAEPFCLCVGQVKLTDAFAQIGKRDFYRGSLALWNLVAGLIANSNRFPRHYSRSFLANVLPDRRYLAQGIAHPASDGASALTPC
jgi:hypothetical protein